MANKPVASANAKPKIVNENKDERKEGFLAVPLIKAANTNPIPIPAPVNPDDANPAPINLAASRIYLNNLLLIIMSLFSEKVYLIYIE